MKTWEQTIEYIRTQPSYRELVEKAYFEEDLPLNVERFMKGEEFQETLRVIRERSPRGNTLLDVGSGNGISAVAFALSGFVVTAIEPDPSNTVGAGAIRKLKEHYKLGNTLSVIESFAEDLQLQGMTFDVIYARQCLHHAYDLPKFLKVLGGLANTGCIFLSTRDHVVYDAADKELFFKSHALHKFYGGENAFTLGEYKEAIQGGGFRIVAEFGHYDSVINYFPLTQEERRNMVRTKLGELRQRVQRKIGVLANIPFLVTLVGKMRGINEANLTDERKVPGRLYTFVAIQEG